MLAMSKKKVGEGSKAPSLPKKAQRAPSSSTAPSTAKGNKNAYPVILLTSTRGLHFANDEQQTKYEILTTRKISEQKFFHVESLRNLGLLDDMMNLIYNLGWAKYIGMQCTSYDRLMLEFLSSWNVNWEGKFRGQEVDIIFYMFNIDYWMSL